MCAPSCALLLCYCPRARTLLSLCEHVHRALRRELRYLSLSARFPLQKTSQRPFKQVKPPSNEEIKKLRFVSSMLTWVLTPDITQKSRETKIEKRRKKGRRERGGYEKKGDSGCEYETCRRAFGRASYEVWRNFFRGFISAAHARVTRCLFGTGGRPVQGIELSPVPRDGPPCSVRAFIRHNGSRVTTIVGIV